MVNQRLVNYISRQLSYGYSFREIKHALLRNGWHELDVDEALDYLTHRRATSAALQQRDGTQPGFTVKALVGIATILLMGMFVLTPYLTGPVCDANDPNCVLPGDSGVTAISCGNDITCFIEAIEGCNPSSVTYDFTTDLFGFVQATSTYYEIRGTESSKCVLYVRVEDAHGHYDENIVQSLVSNGMTLEQVRKQEQEMNFALRSTIGKDGICKFDTRELTTIFQRMRDGDYSSDDWDECEGEIFS
jgi:hypothetical protein